MGEESSGPMAPDREHYVGQIVSSRTQDRRSLGRGAYRKSCLARGAGVRRESWDRQVSAPRPPQDLRPALSCRRRRTGANSVSARSCLNSNNRTISRLQTAYSRCGQRQNWNRATGLKEPLSVRFADDPASDSDSRSSASPALNGKHIQQISSSVASFCGDRALWAIRKLRTSHLQFAMKML